MRISSWGGTSGSIKTLSLPAFSSDMRHRLLAASGERESKCLIVGAATAVAATIHQTTHEIDLS